MKMQGSGEWIRDLEAELESGKMQIDRGNLVMMRSKAQNELEH
jgi:hypothetical protein